MRRLLIVDDEESVRLSLKGVLEDEGFEVLLAPGGEEAVRTVEEEAVDLVLLDIWMPGMDGVEALKLIRDRDPSVKVVMFSGHGTIETAVTATKLGAYDFLEKPIALEKLLITVKNALALKELEEAHLALREEVAEEEELIGETPAMRRLKDEILRVAPSDGWVLIMGENGTGKELVARAIHRHSKRRDKPFVAVNCAAIPDELIESELFGYEKGAFTGAFSRKKGKFELAHQGTIFLDEIGDMSLRTQAKILRVLEEKRFERLGGSQAIKVDVRLIAATNKDLSQEMRKGSFREDLFYRVNVIPLYIPPLRERREDIPLFINYFLRQFRMRGGRGIKEMEGEALELLMSYHWPGNVRELKNIIERLVIMTPGPRITLEDIPSNFKGEMLGPLKGSDETTSDIRKARRDFERRFILKRLEENEWNISKTARAIKIQRSHLHQKIKSLNIDPMCYRKREDDRKG